MARQGAALQTYSLEIVKGGCVDAIQLRSLGLSRCFGLHVKKRLRGRTLIICLKVQLFLA
jgi:hypothetical protein